MRNIFLSLSLMVVTLTGFSQAAQAGNCNNRSRDSQVAGAIIGGIIGGVLGHQIGGGRGNDVATVAGAIGGAIIGGELGCEMGQDEIYQINQTRVTYFDSGYGSPYSWRTNRFQGNIIYTRGGYMVYNRTRIVCRDYQSVVYYGGREERTTGTVCRFPDGSVRDVQSTQVSYDQGGYNPPAPQQYGRVLSDFQMRDLLAVVSNESFDSGKLSALQSMVRMYQNQGLKMTLSQAAKIISLFSFDSGKVSALSIMSPSLLRGSGSIDEVLNQFSFSSSRQQALEILTRY